MKNSSFIYRLLFSSRIFSIHSTLTMSTNKYEQVKRKRKRVTEEISSDEETENCRCRKGCSTRSCSCFKEDGGCNSSCGCKAKCRNIFNHLDYFFSNDKKYSAHPCFAQWLKKTIKTVDALEFIDREKLRKEIIKSEK